MTDDEFDALPIADSVAAMVCEHGTVFLVLQGREKPVAVAPLTMQQLSDIYHRSLAQYKAVVANGGPIGHKGDHPPHSMH